MADRTSDNGLALDAGELDTLFPAFLRIDRTGRIAAAGPSMLEHAGSDLIGADFFARFQVERPAEVADVEGLRRARPMIVTLEAPRRMRLRGISVARPDEIWLLLGHIPDLESPEDAPPLQYSDFSPTDGTLDMLLAAELRSGLLAEARALAEALETQKRAAERANSAKSAFLAAMSHEIRTPMNGVLGLATILAGTELSAEQREMLDVMIASGRSLMDILNDILDLSKIEAGQMELEETVFHLPDLVRGVCELFAPVAGAKGLELDMDLDTQAPYCLGDPVRIRQILVNLVSNAIKFTDSGRVTAEVALRARPEGTLLEIEVSDTGIGMSAEAIERLFQPFVQADSSTTRRYGGTGLGLAITRRICQQMDGRIRVESRLGRGSRFLVDLPLAQSEAPPAPPPEETTDPRLEFGDPHVLVVEDNATNQFVLSHFLRKLGMTFDIVAHGAEALAAWEARPYDAVLMDIEMPVLDGYESTRELRRREQASARPPTPIIALSADAMLENRDKAKLVGMDDFITKPIEIERLETAIWSAIRRNAAQHAEHHETGTARRLA